jgi:hypothetical protein
MLGRWLRAALGLLRLLLLGLLLRLLVLGRLRLLLWRLLLLKRVAIDLAVENGAPGFVRPFPRAACNARDTASRSTFMNSVLILLEPVVGRSRFRLRHCRRLWTTEPRYTVLAQEGREGAHQLARHLPCEGGAAQLSRRLVRPHEGDARHA